VRSKGRSFPSLSGLCVAMLLVGGAARRARAEGIPSEVSGTPLSLALAQAIQLAEARAPEVNMARHAVREAEARRVGAGVVLPSNPRLSMDGRPHVSGTPVGYAANLDVLFELGGAPGARVREADREAGLARSELAVERLRARAAAWSAYTRVRIAERRVKELEEALGIGERVLAASKQRGDAGAAGEIEVSLAAGEVAQFRASMQDATRQLASNLMALRQALDLPATQGLELVTPLENPPDAPDESALVARALSARPELAATKQRLLLLAATGERLEKELFPRTGLYVGIDSAPYSATYGFLGVSVELPIAQRNQGPRARVEAARAGETERRELQARRVAREVISARQAYESRRSELRLLTETAVPAALRTLELVEIGWRAGRFDVFRVTTAAREVARVRGLRLDALEAAWLERIALDYAIGGMNT
jgi:outer membrane protein, heavy metal efflux system